MKICFRSHCPNPNNVTRTVLKQVDKFQFSSHTSSQIPVTTSNSFQENFQKKLGQKLKSVQYPYKASCGLWKEIGTHKIKGTMTIEMIQVIMEYELEENRRYLELKWKGLTIHRKVKLSNFPKILGKTQKKSYGNLDKN